MMASSCSSTTSATSEGYPSVPAALRTTDNTRKRRYVQAHHGMEDAVTAVNDWMSIRMAAEKYDIPHRTLSNKVNGKHERKVGRPTTFTLEEESEICEILVRCSKIGVPLGKPTLIKIVKAIAIAKGMDRAKTTPALRKKIAVSASETRAKKVPLPKNKPKVTVVKSRAKNT